MLTDYKLKERKNMTATAVEKLVKVRVDYTGHDHFSGEFSPETLAGAVKVTAMPTFGLEPSAADKYVLQHDGVNVDDSTPIGAFDKHNVKFDLVLKKPQEKGYVR
jgi:hypothetical protein